MWRAKATRKPSKSLAELAEWMNISKLNVLNLKRQIKHTFLQVILRETGQRLIINFTSMFPARLRCNILRLNHCVLNLKRLIQHMLQI